MLVELGAMKTLLLALLLASPAMAAKRVRVKAHTTKSGKHVPAHVRTSPDSKKSNNWSTRGNTNPYTGKEGTK